MTTHPAPTPHDEHPDSSAQSLMIWLGAAMLVVTAVIILAITKLSLTVGMFIGYGVLLVAVGVVFVYIMRFIGPEDDHD